MDTEGRRETSSPDERLDCLDMNQAVDEEIALRKRKFHCYLTEEVLDEEYPSFREDKRIRTFTTWEDFGAVFEKGKTKEWWHSFVKRIWEDTESVQFDYLDNYAFPQEYIDPKRFFATLQEWFEKETKK